MTPSVASLRQLSDRIGMVSDMDWNRCPLSSESALNALSIKMLNAARLAGQQMNCFDDYLPGKRLTYDFYLQMAGPADDQIHADFKTVKIYQHLARRYPEPITSMAQGRELWPIFWRLLDLSSSPP